MVRIIYINPVENLGRIKREYIKLVDKYWSFGKPDTQFGKPDTVWQPRYAVWQIILISLFIIDPR